MIDEIHLIGNGLMAASYCNGNITEVFGPPYSSGGVFECFMTTEADQTLPQHLPQCGIWNHNAHINGKMHASITDLAVPDVACILRHVESTGEIDFTLRPKDNNSGLFQYCLIERNNDYVKIFAKTFAGNKAYGEYPLPFHQFFSVIIRGDSRVEGSDGYSYHITINGTADIIFVGGPSLPENDEATEYILARDYDSLFTASRKWWKKVISDTGIFNKIPANAPRHRELVKAIEDIIICLTAQQSKEGGVLAGYPYHLGYVRDQLGVSYGMLRLGMDKSARKILEFYIDIYRKNGKILNAQGMGVTGLFHFAENDNTEIPGYLLVQFFRYAQETNDWTLIEENMDILNWLYDIQESQLKNNMMPFNGDETYIAGGLLPRDVINDGSAEATLLFIISSSELYKYLMTKEAYHDRALSIKLTVDKVSAAYTDNFVIDGKYTANNPHRLDSLNDAPAHRYGVCMNMGQLGPCDWFGWTKRMPNGTYVCPQCASRKATRDLVVKTYNLPSALLMPAFLSSPMPGKNITLPYLEELSSKIEKEGYFYSNQENKSNVGYDYGLLLYNQVYFGLTKEATLTYNKLLDQWKLTGAWTEYYRENLPSGTFYRPWESGINIGAIIEYIMSIR